MNMRIPFKVTTESMNNGNETIMNDIGVSKIMRRRFRNFIDSLIFMIQIMKLIFKYIVNSGSEFIKESPVIEEKFTALMRDSKKDVSMINIKDIFLYILSPFLCICESTGRTELRLTGKSKGMSMRTFRTFKGNEAFFAVTAGKEFSDRKNHIFNMGFRK